MPRDLTKPKEYKTIDRDLAAIVDAGLNTEAATRAFQVIVEYLEIDRSDRNTDPGVFTGMWKFRNAIFQHLKSMEWHIMSEAREETTDARRPGDASNAGESAS